ncbi:hypothetical protein ABEF95_009423 [Exophiala dermatitidis]
MKASTLLRSSRARPSTPLNLVVHRSSTASTRRSILLPISSASPSSSTPHLSRRLAAAPFSTTRVVAKGIQPDSAEPTAPKPESSTTGSSQQPAQISDAEYHEIADQYLDTLVLAVEEMSETSNEGIEAEFSAGVLTITHPKNGTYVINKQPPNKQIWLSSPISGPKRYDWVALGPGQHEKEDSTVEAGDNGAGGRWVYLRDGSSLSELLKKELGVEITKHDESDVVGGREGPAGGGAKLE